MMKAESPRPRERSFVRQFANEIGTRFRRYQEEGVAPLPAELNALLDQLERAETGSTEPST
ncbi:MAG: hypothetical protein DI556_02230 [Rhodovulum sulfidophilum]|uniref:Anti-sigma factor NepR domain-containing protein n=1 Tax=Rhodovulum sulfidophilum TaxID=35806 RepID=A0A2W5NJQ9_RHOSU|nr:MAG: hypothetical protein DI556_02230 [Rhodovulum sulfidophilum]